MNDEKHTTEARVYESDRATYPNLRRRAEQRLGKTRADIERMSPEEIKQLVHELQVHQVELQMMNEELLGAQAELANARDRYVDLYESAPVGYLTVDENMKIRECNRAAATLLGVTAEQVVGKALPVLAVRNQRDALYLHVAGALDSPETQYPEVEFPRPGGGHVHVSLQSLSTHQLGEGIIECRVTMTDVTAQRHAEKQVRATAERFRFLYEESHALNVTIAEGGVLLDVNTRALRDLGYVREEVLGQPFANFVRPEQRERLNNLVLGALRGEETSEMDVDVYAKDGSVRTFLTSPGYLSLREDGMPVGVVFSAIDVTERERAREELRRAEERYQEIVDNANEGVWMIDAEANTLFVNDRMAEMLGYTRDELAGRNAFEFVIPDDYPGGMSEFEKRRKTADGRRAEFRYRRKDGGVMHAAVSTSTIRDEQGTVRAILGLYTDITEQKRMERELHAARTRLEELVRAQRFEIHETRDELVQRQRALQAVYALSTESVASLPKMIERATYGLADLLGLPWVAVVRAKNGRVVSTVNVRNGQSQEVRWPAECRLLAEVLERGEAYQITGELPNGTCEGLHAAGNGYRSYLGVPILDETGARLGAICVLDHEETVFVDFEVRIVEIFARYIAHEIVRHEAEEELHQAREMELLGVLTSGVAHEVRNPLNAITILIDAMFNRIGERDDIVRHRDHIKQQVTRLTALMDDLLQLGRPIDEKNKQRIETEELLLEAVSTANQGPSSARHAIDVAIDPAVSRCRVYGDRLRLEQVLINLLDNAAAHSPNGDEIVLSVLQSEDGLVRLQVVDRGSGVPPEDLPKIFDPFFTTRKEGTGLGRSLVKHIVEVHRGEVTLWNN
ncbi:MAG: PAS domain S-box protein, partial [Chitinivibrionales bacterium]|nr:PAS domain S-box protein [Chitinivibrionales bacterium]